VTLRVHVERVVAARPDRGFAMHTDPGELAHWFGPHGFTARSVELDLRVGGRYRIEMRPPEGAPFFLTGELLEIERPTRLVYSFVYEEPDPDDRETVVTVSLAAVAEATTRCTVDQGDFATEARRALHDRGWTDSLDRLEQVLAADHGVGR
jgi:uncharacterized protein YndB with AHSA1/START domain